MEEICQTETHNDFITMEVLGTREITPEKKYLGIGINLIDEVFDGIVKYLNKFL